ncbi:hypothetical protein ALC57_02429 [Trachymyrmex cornetzi]|uniref:DNA-directed DNA polymerase n=1 Tax=Trachymyrmex cornetzi TaxID=471704 RepID=A0A151JNM6_9HYME|nr:hypothetical protein ALC57_02429 [Trachymyrmex cornetzi]
MDEEVEDLFNRATSIDTVDIYRVWERKCDECLDFLRETCRNSKRRRSTRVVNASIARIARLEGLRNVLQQRFEHVGSGRVESQKNGFSWLEIETAFNNRVLTGVVLNSSYIEPRQFLDDVRNIVIDLIHDNLQRHICLKVNTIFNGEFVAYAKRSAESITTKNYELFDTSDLREWYDEHVTDDILAALEEFQERDSGWALSRIPNLIVNVNNLVTEDLMYFDVNNLYGWAMSESLPYGEFQWVDDIERFDVMSVSSDSVIGYILEVDLEYPQSVHDAHVDLPFCPTREWPPGKRNVKLLVTLYNKERYVVYYRNLQQCICHGLRITKIYCILQFAQSPWLRGYIELNTRFRMLANNEFEKNLYKLINNAVFGKLNKPIYIGMCILEIAKLRLYEFHYEYIIPLYRDTCKILYTDTDSLIYLLECENVYEDIKRDIARFDTSDYPDRNAYDIPRVNNKIPGLMKDENCGVIMTEFIGLRAKYIYIYKILPNNCILINCEVSVGFLRRNLFNKYPSFKEVSKCDKGCPEKFKTLPLVQVELETLIGK